MSENENKKNFFEFSNLANLIAVGAPVLILVGLCNKFGFYSASNISAAWIIKLFSPVDLIFASVEILIMYVCAFLYMTKAFSGKPHEINKNVIWQGGLLIFIAFTIYLRDESNLRLCFYMVIGYIGIYLIVYSHLFGKIMGAIFLLGISYDAGFYAGKKVNTQTLPVVALAESISKDKWYLLDNYGDKVVLIKMGDTSQTKFKFVEVNDIEYIENNSN